MKTSAFSAIPLLLLVVTCATVAQHAPRHAQAILLVVPESDTTVTSSPVYRLSASTRPGNSVEINGQAYKVYPSGAFCGLLNLQVGDNPFVITSTSPTGEKSTKSFLITRNKPLETTPADTLVIESALMEPKSDVWLNMDDVLEVQCKGTPGCRGSFMNGIPMIEVPPRGNGLAGIYKGVYKVGANDSTGDQDVTFTLEDKQGRTVTRQSRGRVSFKARGLPLVGVTKGERPALDFGLGEDRLGGAKLSFLKAGIRLAISGKVGDKYRVALTPSQEAWIDTAMVELQPVGTRLPHALTGNWNVYGDEKYDYVSIALGDKLPYASYQELDPTRIIVDIFGATSNSNWITQQLTTREIKNVQYAQPGKAHFRISIELQHKQVWGYGITYEGSNLLIKVRRQPEKLKVKALTFVLDAGHGGSNLGALGSTGAREKDVNLATVLHLQKRLEKKGARVFLTRSDDTNPSMGERRKKGAESDADILISIHSNSIGLTSNPEDTKGVGTFYKYLCFRPLSQFILQEVMKTGLNTIGNVGSFNFGLNSPTELPNVLVELAFMSNPEDEMRLLDDEFRLELAKRIVDGVDEWLQWCDE